MKKLLFLLSLTAIILAGCGQTPVANQPANNNLNNATTRKVNTGPGDIIKGKTIDVTIKDFAFSPAGVTANAGDTVRWTNQDTAPHIVASDPHPAHTDLPGLESKSLVQGDSYEFTFSKTGAFGYHCHLHPSMKGKIIVQ